MIVGAAVVGPSGRPLYLAEFGPSAGRDPLRLEQLLHCSLDVVDERAAAPALPASASATASPTAPAGGAYLGMIYAADRRRVYAQATATRVVLLLVAEDAPVRDDEAAGVFRRIHNALADALCNPFYVQGTPLESARFDKSVRAIVSSVGI